MAVEDMTEQGAAQSQKVIVWGLAAGKGTTQEAAAGALAWRHYTNRQSIPREDWQAILVVKDD